MEDSKTHWEKIYSENASNEVSWYQTHPSISLDLIKATGIGKGQELIDIGGGASTLVDHLLDLGFKQLAVLDVSSAALQQSQHRLGDRAQKVEWLVSDITAFQSKHQFTLWHDRAVFHFLTEEGDRRSYLDVLKKTLKPRGHFIIATFAKGGPERCSGLNIVQYDQETLSRFFGKEFELKETKAETHRTPWDSEQKFIYCRFQKL